MRGEGVMTNIPTELLRTLVAVVDLRSFTKAAQSLGVTQPAVSAQIKRLQGLLGADLLDKSAPGVSLTSAGELVVNYARRLLSINDQILDIAGPRPAAQDAADRRDRRLHRGRHRARADLLRGRAVRICASRSTARNIDVLLRDLREGDADLAIWVSPTGPTLDTRHYWTEPLVWVRSPSTRIDPDASGAAGVLRRGMPVHAQRHGGARARPAANANWRSSARASLGLGAAVAAGFGVMALPRSRADIPGIDDLGRRAAAQAAGHLLRHLCARRRRRRRARADRRDDRRGAAIRQRVARAALEPRSIVGEP